ncbi:unnamed protein product, partial [marine sediment metagenome]
MIKIRVPATTANLGPGFDCLGLAYKTGQEKIKWTRIKTPLDLRVVVA